MKGFGICEINAQKLEEFGLAIKDNKIYLDKIVRNIPNIVRRFVGRDVRPITEDELKDISQGNIKKIFPQD
ncbi:MAG: hypothetical protein ACOX3T_05490 [Bdellovibrionota bacterium]